MKQLSLIVCCSMAVMIHASVARSQVFKPIDPSKRADDIQNKDVRFGTTESKTVTMNTKEMSRSPVSSKMVVLKGDVELNRLELQTLSLGTLTKSSLPQKNFTPKRAVIIVDKVRSEKELDDVRQTRAPVAQRQIRPFAPGGEEELKKQINVLP